MSTCFWKFDCNIYLPSHDDCAEVILNGSYGFPVKAGFIIAPNEIQQPNSNVSIVFIDAAKT